MNHLRFAFRRFVKSPMATLVVVGTLAVAIATTTVIASTIAVVQGLIPAAKSDRLVFVASTDPRRDQAQSGVKDGVALTGTSIPDLADWSERASTFEALAAFRTGSANLTGTQIPLRVRIVRATGNLFDAWKIQPAIGRGFRSEDSRPGAPPVVVLSDRFWRSQSSGKPSLIGRSLMLDGESHAVIGVLPPEAGVGLFKQTDVFVPVVMDPARAARDERRLFVTGLLKPGVTREQAAADLGAIARQLQQEYPLTNAHTGVVVRPLVELLGGQITFLMLLLGFIALLVVSIACANISNVILAREAGRRREFAVRSALGASRSHQITQLMTESFLFSGAAAAAGLVLAWWGLSAIRTVAGSEMLAFNEIAINGQVLAMGLLAAFLMPFGFALVPAIRLSKPDVEELRQGNRGAETRRGRRLREVLVAFQVALALILMLQVALIVQTTWRFHNQEKGFDPRQVLTMRIDLPSEKYPDLPAADRFFTQAIARIQALPDVASAGAATSLPIADREVMLRFAKDGAAAPPPESRPHAARDAVSADYLKTMKIPVLRGRGLDSTDFQGGRPVALVNQEAARLYWPGESPLGKRLAFESAPTQWLEIVGVVGNVRNPDARSKPAPHVVVPSSLLPARAMAIVVRSRGAEPAQLVPAIRAQLAQLDKDQPVFAISTMERVIFDDLGASYVVSGLLTVIGFVSLSLAAAGIYGLVSYSVTQRTREIGLRMALGAQPSTVLKMVLTQENMAVVAGLSVGAVGALALAYVTASAMGEIDLRDPLGYICVLGPLMSLALLASYIPARRATRVDPMLALRAE